MVAEVRREREILLLFDESSNDGGEMKQIWCSKCWRRKRKCLNLN
jgi:hypothetical protein